MFLFIIDCRLIWRLVHFAVLCVLALVALAVVAMGLDYIVALFR